MFKDENLIYVGEHGSQTFNLNDNKSDRDLIIIKKSCTTYIEKTKDRDITYMSIDEFKNRLSLGEIDVYLALFNPIKESDIIKKIRTQILKDSIFNDNLKFGLYKSLKNQIKQFDKTLKDKFLIHTILWYTLYINDNPIDYINNKEKLEPTLIKLKSFKLKENGETINLLVKQYNTIKKERLNKELKNNILNYNLYYNNVKKAKSILKNI